MYTASAKPIRTLEWQYPNSVQHSAHLEGKRRYTIGNIILQKARHLPSAESTSIQ
jgi:hypothetical protein